MNFWTRLKKQIKMCNQTQEGVSSEIKVPFGTFRKWMDRKTYPDANEVVKMAVILNTTVEELVEGEKGEQYLREYVHKKGWEFTPPDRIADIVRDVQGLSDDDLIPVRAVIQSMVGKKKEEAKPVAESQPLSHVN
ncbi:MAG: helix-turn-helix domain-containing protein [Spirochaetaceae bacterium]|jgi:hypothetical protein|nr:helix-turn-helix domain-containing protein [Spirochaetaceae bacterium]